MAALHRICRVYTLLAIGVPALGIATAVSLSELGDAWLNASIVLTGMAALVLALAIMPGQRDAIEAVGALDEAAAPGAAAGRRIGARLGMASGIFSLLWTVVVVLMIVRPGSTTGA
jgi:hypothetical protein